jgi:hypothetical protein
MKRRAQNHQVTAERGINESGNSDTEDYSLNNVKKDQKKAYRITPTINGVDVTMEIDTGASLSLISEKTYKKIWPKKSAPKLQPTRVNLWTYTREKIEVLGKINVMVEINNQKVSLDLMVVKGDGPSLLGIDWLQKLKLDWNRVFSVTTESKLQELLATHKNLFKDELGKVKGMEVKIHLKPDAQPKFCRPRPVAFALRKRVEEELDRLQSTGVIQPIQQSEWASPIVPVVKPDGNIRICGDFKVMLNKCIRVDSYPLPRIDELLGLAGGKTFTKFDLAHAYMQLELEEKSKPLTTINTHKGLFQYNRLPFGVASAPAVFQRTMEILMQGIPQVFVYIDDILITGKTEEEHMQHLKTVLEKLEKAGMRLKQEKCYFMRPSVEYLGHVLSEQGIQPSKKNIEAITAAPTPTNVSQLKSFLGMVTYYLKFVPNLSDILAPLYSLLQKGRQWQWGKQQEEAFRETKKKLTSTPVLTPFDPEKTLVLSCDASPYGIGAVLAHRETNGTEKPIAYTSRSLAVAEKRYSQLDKEALALVFGVKKFHNYLYGRNFKLMSDHKPLKYILGESSPIPQMASARLQRWALILGAYTYNLEYRAGKNNLTADALSRNPLSTVPREVSLPGETIMLMETLNATPTTAKQIAKWTKQDRILSRVYNMVLNGRIETADQEFKPYRNRINELSVHNGCILWGNRVVIPPQGQEQTLKLLHEGHIGISRMKASARSYVWWPRMDQEIEEMVKKCSECQRLRHSMNPVTPSMWDTPKGP